MNTLQQQYRAILKSEKTLIDSENKPTYYPNRDLFVKQLAAFLREDFSKLKTLELLKICSLVSTYRPVAPHSFLITCGNLINA